MKIDVFSHIMPEKYVSAAKKKTERVTYLNKALATLNDLDARFRMMDKYPELVQVLTLASPPLETLFKATESAELARIANDALAELVARYPNRFAGAVAILPTEDMHLALKETERVIKDLKLKGVMLYTPANGRPLDHQEFMPLYEMMSRFGLPIWIHPWRDRTFPDYAGENESKYWVAGMWGWPYETTVAMTRLVFSGTFEKYPELKFIIHHCGAMVPFLANRIVSWYEMSENRFHLHYQDKLTRPPVDYFRKFYVDTAINGSTPGLMCGHAFFGTEHMLFGTDMPFDSELGERSIRETISSIERMGIPEGEKRMIFEENVRNLLHLRK